MEDTTTTDVFWGTKKFLLSRTFSQSFTIRNFGLFQWFQAIQMSSETGLTQTFFLSKLVEKYSVVKIKFCWCVNSLSLTLTKQLKLCGLPLKNNNQTLISACLLPKYFMTGESVRNQPDRINRTLWTVVRFLMLVLILSWSCNLMVSQPVYFNIIFYVPFCLCSINTVCINSALNGHERVSRCRSFHEGHTDLCNLCRVNQKGPQITRIVLGFIIPIWIQ